MTLMTQMPRSALSDRRVSNGPAPDVERRSGLNRRAVARPVGVAAIIGMLAVPGIANAQPAFASPAAVAGTYVGTAPTGAFLLQLAGSGKDQLTGHYEQVQLLPNGMLQDANFSVAGATSNGTIAVVIKLADSNAAPIAAFGSLDHGVLHLSSVNGGGLALTLQKADSADSGNFHAQVAALADQSQHQRGNPVQMASYQLAASHTAPMPSFTPPRGQATQPARQAAPTPSVAPSAALLSRLDTVLQTHSDYLARATQQLDRFADLERQYHDMTQHMRASFNLEQSMDDHGQALFARSQINGAIRKTATDSAQLHMLAQADQSQFEAETAALARDTDEAAQACQSSLAGASGPVAAACAGLLQSARDFQQHAQTIRQAFQTLEQTWRAETRQSETLLAAASDAARG